MANKIFQKVIGDMLFIQLDADPTVDGIGFSAPLGSMAFNSNGQAFIKVIGGPKVWHSITNTFLNGGNNFGSAPQLILGSTVDKDLSFIRNSLIAQKFIKETNTSFYGVSISLVNDAVRLRHHTAKDGSRFSDSFTMENVHLAVSINQKDRSSVGLISKGYVFQISNLGHVELIGPIGSFSPEQNITIGKYKNSYAILNKLISGNFSVDTGIMVDTDSKLMMVEVSVIVSNVSTGDVSQRKKIFTVKSNFLNKSYSAVFDADIFSYFEDAVIDFDLNFSFTSDTNAVYPLNTFKHSVFLKNLTVGQSYDIAVWVERLGMEDNN
jgi:hypothetical protein